MLAHTLALQINRAFVLRNFETSSNIEKIWPKMSLKKFLFYVYYISSGETNYCNVIPHLEHCETARLVSSLL